MLRQCDDDDDFDCGPTPWREVAIGVAATTIAAFFARFAENLADRLLSRPEGRDDEDDSQ